MARKLKVLSEDIRTTRNHVPDGIRRAARVDGLAILAAVGLTAPGPAAKLP